jgi:hypothetical protein
VLLIGEVATGLVTTGECSAPYGNDGDRCVCAAEDKVRGGATCSAGGC